jgi:hypothetical protein
MVQSQVKNVLVSVVESKDSQTSDGHKAEPWTTLASPQCNWVQLHGEHQMY